MMKPPIIIIEHWDISVHPSVEHAEAFLEVADVQDGIYTAYDCEGVLLELTVGKVKLERHFLVFKWAAEYDSVIIQESIPKEERSLELKGILQSYLERQGVSVEEIRESSLINLIERIAKDMPWKIPKHVWS